MANLTQLRAAIFARLSGAGSLADAGGRFYGGDVPETPLYPYVEIALASGGPSLYDLEGEEAVSEPAFRVVAVGRDGGGFDDLRPLSDAIDALFSGWRVEPGAGVELPFHVAREGEIEEKFPLAGSSHEFIIGGIYRFTCTPGGAG